MFNCAYSNSGNKMQLNFRWTKRILLKRCEENDYLWNNNHC